MTPKVASCRCMVIIKACNIRFPVKSVGRLVLFFFDTPPMISPLSIGSARAVKEKGKDTPCQPKPLGRSAAIASGLPDGLHFTIAYARRHLAGCHEPLIPSIGLSSRKRNPAKPRSVAVGNGPPAAWLPPNKW